MGILRVYLALCVVAAHSGKIFPWQMHEGFQAVQIFYIISGFYMALVLSSRYSTPREFYLSRFLRIFPPYWAVLAGTIVVSVLFGLSGHRWLMLAAYARHPFVNSNEWLGVALAALSNVTIFGQDWMLFLSHDRGQSLQFTANFWNDPHPLWRYLLIPQSWSVGIELSFYAIAPFLNRCRTGWLVLIATTALGLRGVGYKYFGLAYDPWTYRFFPFEISLFILGMLAYRWSLHPSSYHLPARFRCESTRAYVLAAAVLLLGFYLSARAVSGLSQWIDPRIAPLFSYPLWALALPGLFFVFGKRADDRAIGELSYPIYLTHVLVVSIIKAPLAKFADGHGTGLVAALLSITASVVLYRRLIMPLDRKRHFLAHAKPPLSP